MHIRPILLNLLPLAFLIPSSALAFSDVPDYNTHAQAIIYVKEKGMVGGKTLSLQWDNGANALVNHSEKIIAIRTNAIQDGKEVAVNEVYAWSKDPNQRERIMWIKIGTNNSGHEVFAWQNESPINGTTSIWRKKDGVYEFIDINLFKYENKIL